MDPTPDALAQTVRNLRRAHAETLAPLSQSEVVDTLADWADRWRDPDFAPRREAEAVADPFPFGMVRVSLDALLDSLTPDALWTLIDSEDCREARGGAVVGHVIAANTPLLAWVSVLRALLVRSASLVKLPSGPAAEWGRLFYESLRVVSPALAGNVALRRWPGGTASLDAALCRSSDLVLAYGSDATIQTLRALCPPPAPFVGYGHRVSCAVLPRGTATAGALAGLARDVLMYDQGGCLSPQTIFAEGDWAEALAVAERLAGALQLAAAEFPLPVRSPRAAPAVAEARALALMDPDCRVWAGADRRWTVIARPERAFLPSPTFGVVSVQPLASLGDLPEALSPVAPVLQGCAVGGNGAADFLPSPPYLCAPGALQAPPLSWRQDGRDVLRSLLPPRACP